jgi:hypothetical protein
MKKILFLFASFLTLYAGQQNYWNNGIQSANSILGKTKSDMKGRITDPITNGKELYTYDNSAHGDASITCSKEGNIIQIGYSTIGGGDINLRVNEDLDLNGNYEKSFSMNGVSGICANGVIICNSGSWNNCHYYKISFNGNNLTYNEVNKQNLGGCYCINNSCGSISSNSKPRVLSDLGGMFAQTVRNNYYIVSNIVLSGGYSYVKGKNVNCNGETVPVGMSESDLQSKTEEKKANDIDNNNTTYYVLNQTTKNVNNNPVDKDFTNNLKENQSKVSKSASWNKNNQSFSYTDKDGKDVNGNLFVGDVNKTEYCEVEYEENNPDVFSDGTNRKNATSSATTKKTDMIECVKQGDNWVCPVKAGQTIKHDCGKINDFPEVAGTLSAINDAVKDFTCSK